MRSRHADGRGKVSDVYAEYAILCCPIRRVGRQ